jgi:L-rhamnose isomerase
MMNAVTAAKPSRLYYIPGTRAANDDLILSLKPTATLLLRIQGPRSQLHAYISSLKRAKHALELAKITDTSHSFTSLLRIAVSTIGSEIAAAKMALLASEEALREAQSCVDALQVDSDLHSAAQLVIQDYEADRAETIALMNDVRNLCQPFQAAVK